MTLNPGDILNNRFRIKDILGQGGMGAVYHAFDENLSIHVAVKENLFLSNEYGKQFQREANILAGLRHPNLPHVIDYFILPNQGQYLIMDYIDGEDLRQRLERVGRLPEKEIILIGAAICDALTYLHSRIPPIIHRDIKPGNIKITPDGNIYLVDFGLAKIMLGDQATSTGARAMTPGYSPPEQYGTAPTDSRSDIYALGATLYATLTGTIPEDALARAMGKAKLTPIIRLSPDASPELSWCIEKALETEPDNRYQNADEFHNALIKTGDFTLASNFRITITPPPPQPISQPREKNAFQKDNSIRSFFERKFPLGWVFASVVLLLAAILFLVLRQPLPYQLIPTPTTAGSEVTLQATIGAVIPAATTTMEMGTSTPRAFTPTPLATLSPDPTSLPASPYIGGGRGEIAYSSDQSGTMQIWMMNSDGSNPRQITDMIGGACQPAWSPDGAILAFISPCMTKRVDYSTTQIFIMDLKGDGQPEPIKIPGDPYGDFDPAWSPDGKKIAFTSLRNNQRANIFIYDIEKETLVNITAEDKIERQPAWSPDGKWIAYVNGNTLAEIWVVSVDNTQRMRVSAPAVRNNTWPAWSSDSNMIFFSQFQDANTIPHLYARRFDASNPGGPEIRIPATEPVLIGPVVQVSLSPDGKWIAYESWPDGKNHDIYIMTTNGLNPTRLTSTDSFEFSVAWRPGSEQ